MHVNRQEKRTRFNNPSDARCKANWNISSTTKWVATPGVAKNDSTQTRDAGAVTTQNEHCHRARIIVPGTILIVLVRILAVNASHLRSKKTRTYSPVTCTAKIANIPTTSAHAIKKMRKRRTSQVTTLKIVGTTRTTATTVATVAGTIPRQASVIFPFQAMG